MALGIAVVCLRDRCQRLVAAGSEANATRGAELHSASLANVGRFWQLDGMFQFATAPRRDHIRGRWAF